MGAGAQPVPKGDSTVSLKLPLSGPERVLKLLTAIEASPSETLATEIGVELSKLGTNFKTAENQAAFSQADKVLRSLLKSGKIEGQLYDALDVICTMANTFYLDKHKMAAADPNYCRTADEKNLLRPVRVLGDFELNEETTEPKKAIITKRFEDMVKALEAKYEKSTDTALKSGVAAVIASLYYTAGPKAQPDGSIKVDEKAFATNAKFQALLQKIIVDQFLDTNLPVADRYGSNLCFFHWENQCDLPAETFGRMVNNEALPTAIRAQLIIFGCHPDYGSADQKAWVAANANFSNQTLREVAQELTK